MFVVAEQFVASELFDIEVRWKSSCRFVVAELFVEAEQFVVSEFFLQCLPTNG